MDKKSALDFETWRSSSTYGTIRSVLLKLNDSVRCRLRPSKPPRARAVEKIKASLDRVSQLLSEFPAVSQSAPFGNQAFVPFHAALSSRRSVILGDVTSDPAVQEYFVRSFGNPNLVDFGTGHEFCFLAFLSSLFGAKVLSDSDAATVVFGAFWTYWDVVIAMLSQYRLEPAGTTGAWGLNDFVMLPFLFGSAQLVGQVDVTPANVVDAAVARQRKEENAYSKWIDFVHQTKSGAFEEHSRLLFSLTEMPSFVEINEGVMKMYEGEVMNKFCVFQAIAVADLCK
jgi:serine/threonine-protein phosphatase 2A activator